MARPLRIEYPGALYHITSRGNERKDLFFDDGDRRKFLQILQDYHDRYGILIHSYILMGNHYHLMLETPKGNLLKVMHGINGRYTGYLNRKYGRVGHLFQGRYRGILVEKDAYLIPLSRYVHLNPVRARMAERPEEYGWSSYPGYLGKTKEEDWVEYSWILSAFGPDRAKARRGYRAYTEEGLHKKMESPLQKLHGRIILGGEEFIDQIKERVRGKTLSHDIIERRRLVDSPTLEEMVEIVARAFGVQEEAIRGKRGQENTARKAALYFAQRYTGESNEAIGKWFGGIHYSAVSKASARFKQEMASDPKLSKLVKAIDSHFKA